MRFDFFSGYIKALFEFEYYIIQVMIWKMERKRLDLYDPFLEISAVFIVQPTHNLYPRNIYLPFVWRVGEENLNPTERI